MKRIRLLFFVCVAVILLIINFSCSKGNTTGGNTNTGGKDSILINIGNNIILPAYQSLTTAVNSLDSAIIDFNAEPNNTKLSNVQVLFKTAYVAWQSASEYNGFGAASDNQPSLSSLNKFPSTVSTIENDIATNNDNVNTFANETAKGFPALDYLLFGTDNATLLTNYTSDPKAANRKLFLAAVSADIKTEVDAVSNSWSTSGGNYINTFINGKGTDVSSSLGLLINSLDQDIEILKNYRLGVPLGKVLGDSSISANLVEAYYSGISAQLALTQLKAIQSIYLGTGAQGNGLGLDDYLIPSNKTYNGYSGSSLNDTIKVHLAGAITDLQAVADPLSSTIQTNPANADAAFAQTQQLVLLFKTDMPSLLGVLITYGDNDGD